MPEENLRGTPRHGLSFIATLAFLGSFFGARLFTTLYPNVVVIRQGIHFHHFWYGIGMLGGAGWLGIAWRRSDRLNRIYAVLYGLGAGFLGDEVGLLLTFGDYQSELTYLFFVLAISFSLIAVLLLRYGEHIERDVIQLAHGERLSHFGIFITGFSTIFFAFGLPTNGIPIIILGIVVILFGRWHERRHSTKTVRVV